MVDFKKRLAGKKAEKPTDPVKLYETLDRAHDKGPLRPDQLAVLTDWFATIAECGQLSLVSLVIRQDFFAQETGW